jgi:hypothetical protein
VHSAAYIRAVVALGSIKGVHDVVLVTKQEGQHPRARSAQAEGIFRGKSPTEPPVPNAQRVLEAGPVRPETGVPGAAKEPASSGTYDALNEVLAGPEAGALNAGTARAFLVRNFTSQG